MRNRGGVAFKRIVTVLCFKDLAFKFKLLYVIRHVLKVDCQDGIIQVLDLLDSDFDVLCLELVAR